MTIFPTLNGLQKRGNLVGEGISEWVVKDMFTQYRLKRQGVYILCACVRVLWTPLAATETGTAVCTPRT